MVSISVSVTVSVCFRDRVWCSDKYYYDVCPIVRNSVLNGGMLLRVQGPAAAGITAAGKLLHCLNMKFFEYDMTLCYTLQNNKHCILYIDCCLIQGHSYVS